MVDRADLASCVEDQVNRAIAEANLLLFVVDIQEGPTALDERVASILRSTGKPVILGANKADRPGLDGDAVEFFRYGFGEALPLSAEHRRNLGDLMDTVATVLPAQDETEVARAAVMRLCVVGRRNSGKSTLVNGRGAASPRCRAPPATRWT